MSELSAQMTAFFILLGFISVFRTFDKEIRIGSDIKPYNSKKGYIKIDIFKSEQNIVFSDILYSLYQDFNYLVFVFLAAYASDKFYNEFPAAHNKAYGRDTTSNRDFLFSLPCIADEIYKHCMAYWWVEGKVERTTTTYLMWKYVGGDKEKLKSRCKTIDIFEQDVTDIADKNMFGYYNGILDKYKKTMADPFYSPRLKIRSTLNIREEWKTNKIPII